MQQLFTFLPILFFFISVHLSAQTRWALVTDPDNAALELAEAQGLQRPDLITIDIPDLRRALAQNELRDGQEQQLINLPDRNGQPRRFLMRRVAILPSGLQQRYPQIATWSGWATDDPQVRVRLTLSALGMSMSVRGQATHYYIDPVPRDDEGKVHLLYRNDEVRTDAPGCLNDRRMERDFLEQARSLRASNGRIEGRLISYRLAVTATSNYTGFFGRDSSRVMGAVVNSVNRVNQITEQDLALRLVLVDSTDKLFYYNPDQDPFEDTSDRLSTNQRITDDSLGRAAYDIGHVFDQANNGGVAFVGSICNAGIKAQGYTSGSPPQGYAFDVRVLAHEFGHQFGSPHTFNGVSGSCGPNRSSDAAFEPGSGTTIMSYAGICGPDNIQPNPDPQYHSGSIEFISDYTAQGGGSVCATTTATEQLAPVIINDQNPGWVIPSRTPFRLQGQLAAPEAGLRYSWEQFDLGTAEALGTPDPEAPLFRVFPPRLDSVRLFPRRSVLLDNSNDPAEVLPTVSRSMNFRLLVRDQRDTVGALTWQDLTFEVAGEAGPFSVEQPDNALAGTLIPIRWDVALTNLPPVSADSVEIALSVDGGQRFTEILSAATPNDGVQYVRLPDSLSTDVARVRVRALGNIFFNVNRRDFSIELPVEPAFSLALGNEQINVCPGDSVALVEVITSGTAMREDSVNLELEIPFFLTTPLTIRLGANDTLRLPLQGRAGLERGVYPGTLRGTEDAFAIERSLAINYTPESLQINQTDPSGDQEDLRPLLSWENIPTADFYEVVLREEIAGDPIISSGPVTEAFFQIEQPLEQDTEYNWSVQAFSAACGEGPINNPNFFTTEPISCKTYQAEDLPLDLASGATPVYNSSIVVEDGFAVRDVNVRRIQGEYQPTGDLIFRLKGPSGLLVDLLPRKTFCDSFDTFNFSVDDASKLENERICPNDFGFIFKPSEPLDQFYDVLAAGRWQLFIITLGRDGVLNNWELELCGNASAITTDILEIEEGKSLRLSPNPARNEVELRWEGLQLSSLRITDMQGRELRRVRVADGSQQRTISLQDLPAGLYLVQAIDERGRRYSQKLVKSE